MESDLDFIFFIVLLVVSGTLIMNAGTAANNVAALCRTAVLPANIEERMMRQYLRMTGSLLVGFVMMVIGLWVHPGLLLAGLVVVVITFGCGVDYAEDARKIRSRPDFVPMFDRPRPS